MKTKREMFRGIISASESVEKGDVVEKRKHGNIIIEFERVAGSTIASATLERVDAKRLSFTE